MSENNKINSIYKYALIFIATLVILFFSNNYIENKKQKEKSLTELNKKISLIVMSTETDKRIFPEEMNLLYQNELDNFKINVFQVLYNITKLNYQEVCTGKKLKKKLKKFVKIRT